MLDVLLVCFNPTTISYQVYDYLTSSWVTPTGMSNISSPSALTWYNQTATSLITSDKVRIVASDNGLSVIEFEVYGGSSGGKSGLVSTNHSAIPFWTTTNPINISLNASQSQLVTFIVNASGENSTANYNFFGYANITENEVISSKSDEFNVTISSYVNPLQIVYPVNTIYNEEVTELNYTLNAVGDSCWYSINNGATNSSIVSAGTNFTGLSSVGGLNTWIIYCNDTSGEFIPIL
jgi:hypothetical protein